VDEREALMARLQPRVFTMQEIPALVALSKSGVNVLASLAEEIDEY
jgi:hypothetical protein